MDPMSILFPVLSVGGMGVVFGACLGVASEVFKVEEDPRIGQVLECLPGANCGGCGFPVVVVVHLQSLPVQLL